MTASKGAASCPACDGTDLAPLLDRERVPVFLNRTWPTREDARGAPAGRLELSLCGTCGFAWNRAFEQARVDYDPEYDNDVMQSPAFVAHLEAVARRAVGALPEARGLAVEVGCGQGQFLQALARLARSGSVEAVGFDPAFRGEPQPDGIRIERAWFDAERARALDRAPDLLVSRHVIEHVPDPVTLVRDMVRCVGSDRAIPVLVETPSFEWIVENEAFFDVFYEHCNYFSEAALRTACGRGGLAVDRVDRLFGGQYQLLAGRVCADETAAAIPRPVVDARSLARAERRLLERVRSRVDEASKRGPVALWGAAAKGVTLAQRIDPEGERLAGLIDVNPAKQGRFAPGSGLAILSPERAVRSGVRTAFVMNPVYLAEIRDMAAAAGSDLRIERL